MQAKLCVTTPLVLRARSEVLTDDAGPDLLDQGGAGDGDRLEGDRVSCGHHVAHCGSSVRAVSRATVRRTWQDGDHAGRALTRCRATPGRGDRSGDQAHRQGDQHAAASYTFRQARRASRAEGAGDSGLYRLIELHAFNAAGDAAVAISLAGTLFFAQPGEARGQVALFLGLTMLPFAIVAPLLGPFLDRFSHGRRWAIGGTMALRAFLCWLMADAVASQSIAMFPTALGVLVSSKAYGVARAATVPRLLPSGLTLVKANSRISLAGVVGAAIAAPLAGLASTFGSQWSLRFAFLVFAGATILSILLPAKADAHGGRAAGQPERGQEEVPGAARRGRSRCAATPACGCSRAS